MSRIGPSHPERTECYRRVILSGLRITRQPNDLTLDRLEAARDISAARDTGCGRRVDHARTDVPALATLRAVMCDTVKAHDVKIENTCRSARVSLRLCGAAACARPVMTVSSPVIVPEPEE
eukprot:scaffold14348_cov46-Phaeocystis_antarctica.AAC.2